MKNARVEAFTLVELLVVIAIIGTMVGLLLPAIQASREASRTSTCSINLTQLQKAMQLYEEANQQYPGYVETLGFEIEESKAASWVVMMLPFIEQDAVWQSWNSMSTRTGKTPRVEVLVCPSNAPHEEGTPALSYVANAGSIENEPEDTCVHRRESPGNGVFFDHWRYPHGGIMSEFVDQRDCGSACCLCPTSTQSCECADPKIKMTLAHVQTGDGGSSTLMLAESLRSVYWADGARCRLDRKWHFGFCWGQPDEVLAGIREGDDRQYARINGQREPSDYEKITDMQPLDAFPSSHHPGGVNAAFVAGNVKRLNEKISPLVYAQLMTSNRSKSQLQKIVDGENLADKYLDQPNDDQY